MNIESWLLGACVQLVLLTIVGCIVRVVSKTCANHVDIMSSILVGFFQGSFHWCHPSGVQ